MEVLQEKQQTKLTFLKLNKMEILNRIISLPDYMNIADINEEFCNLLNYCDESNNWDLSEIVSAIWELSDRQWHTYELIDKNIGEKIKEWIRKNIDYKNVELVEDILGVVGMLGFQDTYNGLRENLKSYYDNKIPLSIKEVLNDFGDDISDPYISLRNLKPPI